MGNRNWIRWVAERTPLVLVLGLVLFGFFREYDIPFAAMELPAAMAEAKRLGIPLTSADLPSQPSGFSISNDPNVPETGIVGINLNNLSTLYSFLDYPDPDWVSATEVVKSSEAQLNDARLHLNSGVFLPPKDWDMEPVRQRDGHDFVREFAEGYCAAALVSSHNQDFAKAGEYLSECRRIAKIAVSQGEFSAQRRIDKIVNRTVELCLAEAASSTVAIRALRQAALNSEPDCDYVLVLKIAAYSDVATARNFEKFGGQRFLMWGSWRGPPPPSPESIKRSDEPDSMLAKAYLTRCLQSWSDVFTFIEAHPNRPYALRKYVEQTIEPLMGKRGPRSYDMDNVWLTVNQMIAGTFACQADYRCKLALAVALEFRSVHGRFPRNLAETGADFVDPFDRAPLRYRAEDDKLTIWSIGRDMKDDRGNSKMTSKGYPDIVASYPPVLREKHLGGAIKGLLQQVRLRDSP